MSTRKQIEDLVATVIWGEDTANATRLGKLVVDALVEHGVLLLNQTTPSSPEADVAYVESLRKRAEDEKASADHRAALVIATACELLGQAVGTDGVGLSWEPRVADFIHESTTVDVTHEPTLSVKQWLDATPSDVADMLRRYDGEERATFLVHLFAKDDRPANVMSPSGQSVLGMALPAKHEDRRTRMWGVRCYRNGVKAHLVHNEDGQLLVFSESVAVALAKPVVDIVDLRYEAELMP